MARASAFQAEGRGFESRFPLHLPLRQKRMFAHIAQSVERILGKDEVTSSNLVVGSIFFLRIFVFRFFVGSFTGFVNNNLSLSEKVLSRRKDNRGRFYDVQGKI